MKILCAAVCKKGLIKAQRITKMIQFFSSYNSLFQQKNSTTSPSAKDINFFFFLKLTTKIQTKFTLFPSPMEFSIVILKSGGLYIFFWKSQKVFIILLSTE